MSRFDINKPMSDKTVPNITISLVFLSGNSSVALNLSLNYPFFGEKYNVTAGELEIFNFLIIQRLFPSLRKR